MSHLLTDKYDIEQWLIKNKVQNYVLVPDEKYGFVVNTHGSVDLSRKGLTCIEVKFNEIVKGFNCCQNQLTSLEGCPEIVHLNFNCAHNNLTSLEFCPQEIGGDFNCSNNYIASLEFIPNKMEWGFYAGENSRLGTWQNIEDFKLIKKEHLRFKSMMQLKNKLEETIEMAPSTVTSKSKI